MYKGTKFNCKKEDVEGEKYLGMQIFRFYMHCRKCSAEITYKTDPQNHDYQMEHGATRNFEAVKHEQSIEEALKAKRAAEDEDKLKRIENKTADAKREMDMFEKLDDILHTKGQHAAVTTEAAIAALQAKAADDARATGNSDLTEADEKALQLMVEGGMFTRRLEDENEEHHASQKQPGTTRRLAAPTPRRQGLKVQPAIKRKQAVQPSIPVHKVAAVVGANMGSKSVISIEQGCEEASWGCTANGIEQQGIAGAKPQTGASLQQGAVGLGLGTYSSSSGSGEEG